MRHPLKFNSGSTFFFLSFWFFFVTVSKYFASRISDVCMYVEPRWHVFRSECISPTTVWGAAEVPHLRLSAIFLSNSSGVISASFGSLET